MRQAQLAQLVEQRTENPCVSGSIPELGIIQQIKYCYAGDGNRTHVSSLEGWCSTIELHPQSRGDRIRTCDLLVPNQALYQAKLHPDISEEACPDRGRVNGALRCRLRNQRSGACDGAAEGNAP